MVDVYTKPVLIELSQKGIRTFTESSLRRYHGDEYYFLDFDENDFDENEWYNYCVWLYQNIGYSSNDKFSFVILKQEDLCDKQAIDLENNLEVVGISLEDKYPVTDEIFNIYVKYTENDDFKLSFNNLILLPSNEKFIISGNAIISSVIGSKYDDKQDEKIINKKDDENQVSREKIQNKNSVHSDDSTENNNKILEKHKTSLGLKNDKKKDEIFEEPITVSPEVERYMKCIKERSKNDIGY